MGLFLMILFAGLEAALVVLTFTKCKEQKKWLVCRTVIRAAQLLAFLLVMLLPHVTFDFKYKLCFFILLIRLLRNGLVLMVKRKSAEGDHSRGRAVVAGVFATLSLVLALVPSLMFAEYEGLAPSGQYEVKSAQAILIDENREETFLNDGSKREVAVTFYYPQAASEDSREFPLVVFSHGAFGYSKSNYSTYMELASNGYVVAALDHPYHAFFCKNSKGKTVTVNLPFINEVMAVNDENTPENDIYDLSSKWLKIRKDDMNFVLDTLKEGKTTGLKENWYTEDESNKAGVCEALTLMDTEHIGLMGHSLGGAASVTVGRNRKDIGAVVDLDGTMLGEQTGFENGKYSYEEEAYPVALLVMDSQIHHEEAEYYKALYVNNYIVDNAQEAYRVYMKDSAHMNFTDLPLFSPALASYLGTGEVDATECIQTMNSLVLQFMNYELKGQGSFNPAECY